MSVNAKQIIEVLINHGQVQLSKHNIDVITQKVLNLKPLNIVLVGRNRQFSIADLNRTIFMVKGLKLETIALWNDWSVPTRSRPRLKKVLDSQYARRAVSLV